MHTQLFAAQRRQRALAAQLDALGSRVQEAAAAVARAEARYAMFSGTSGRWYVLRGRARCGPSVAVLHFEGVRIF